MEQREAIRDNFNATIINLLREDNVEVSNQNVRAQQNLLSLQQENPARAGQRRPPAGDPGALLPLVLDPIGSSLAASLPREIATVEARVPNGGAGAVEFGLDWSF